MGRRPHWVLQPPVPVPHHPDACIALLVWNNATTLSSKYICLLCFTRPPDLGVCGGITSESHLKAHFPLYLLGPRAHTPNSNSTGWEGPGSVSLQAPHVKSGPTQVQSPVPRSTGLMLAVRTQLDPLLLSQESLAMKCF